MAPGASSAGGVYARPGPPTTQGQRRLLPAWLRPSEQQQSRSYPGAAFVAAQRARRPSLAGWTALGQQHQQQSQLPSTARYALVDWGIEPSWRDAG